MAEKPTVNELKQRIADLEKNLKKLHDELELKTEKRTAIWLMRGFPSR